VRCVILQEATAVQLSALLDKLTAQNTDAAAADAAAAAAAPPAVASFETASDLEPIALLGDLHAVVGGWRDEGCNTAARQSVLNFVYGELQRLMQEDSPKPIIALVKEAAQSMESCLYRAAGSSAEFTDVSSLPTRLRWVAQTFGCELQRQQLLAAAAPAVAPVPAASVAATAASSGDDSAFPLHPRSDSEDDSSSDTAARPHKKHKGTTKAAATAAAAAAAAPEAPRFTLQMCVDQAAAQPVSAQQAAQQQQVVERGHEPLTPPQLQRNYSSLNRDAVTRHGRQQQHQPQRPQQQRQQVAGRPVQTQEEKAIATFSTAVLNLMYTGIKSVDEQMNTNAGFKAAHAAMLLKPNMTLSEALEICRQCLSTQCSEAALKAGLLNVQKGFAELDTTRALGSDTVPATTVAAAAAAVTGAPGQLVTQASAVEQQQQQRQLQQHQKVLSNNNTNYNSSSSSSDSGSSSSSSSSSSASAGSASASSDSSAGALHLEWQSKSNSNTVKLQLVQVIRDSGARSTVQSELIRLLLDGRTGHITVELDHVVATADEAISEVQLSQQLGNMIVTSPLLSSSERDQLLTRLSKVT
jgi:hypothetical protein